MDRFYQHLAYVIYKPCSENDLKLVACNEYAFDQINIFNPFHIRFVIVTKNQSQAGRAVCDPEDIVPAPGEPDQF